MIKEWCKKEYAGKKIFVLLLDAGSWEYSQFPAYTFFETYKATLQRKGMVNGVKPNILEKSTREKKVSKCEAHLAISKY